MAINYVYAYKTKARAFESIKDARRVGRRETVRERAREREKRERKRERWGVTFMHRVVFDGPIIPRHVSL